MRRRGLATCVAACVVALAGCGYGGDSGGARTINWYVFKEPGGAFDKAVATCNQQANGRYQLKLVPLPTNADQQRELLVRRLAAEDKDVDLMGMDVIWTAEFSEAGWLREFTGDRRSSLEENTIPALLDTAKYKDKVWAAPLNTNTQLLWYRKDRVSTPPQSWDDMIDQAEELGPSEGQIQVQAAQYEGYTVWFSTLVAGAGGRIIDENGEVAVDDKAVDAAKVIQRLANSPVAPPGMSNNREDQARLGFESGQTAFMVNYTFVYPSAKTNAPDIFEQMGVAQYPATTRGGESHPPLGGINIGVSKYSENAELAFEAALCLRQPENQIVAAELGGLPPTIEALYDDPAIEKAFPFADELKTALANGVPRPSHPQYADISLAVQKTMHPPKDVKPDETVDKLKDALETVLDGGLF